jgi:hypothetical protein
MIGPGELFSPFRVRARHRARLPKESREGKEDIPLLVEYFLEKAAKEAGE